MVYCDSLGDKHMGRTPRLQTLSNVYITIVMVPSKVGTIRSSEHSYCFGCNELVRQMDRLYKKEPVCRRRGEKEWGLDKLPTTTAGG